MHKHATPAGQAGNPGRRQERHRDHGTLPAQLRRSGDVLVPDGYGLAVTVDHGRLVARDGTGRDRRERTFG